MLNYVLAYLFNYPNVNFTLKNTRHWQGLITGKQDWKQALVIVQFHITIDPFVGHVEHPVGQIKGNTQPVTYHP